MEVLRWFRDLKNDDVAIAGGKGASLGEMYNAGLPVPPGFVVTAQTYKSFIQVTGIQNKIDGLLKNLDVENTEELNKVSKQIQVMILSAEMPIEIKHEIAEAYDSLNVGAGLQSLGRDTLSIIKTGRDSPYVAVRSSATAEDLPSISENEYVFVKINGKPFFGKMKELFNNFTSGADLLIPAMDNFNVEWRRVSDIYKHKVNSAALYKITTSTGRQITISPNHTLIILDERTLQPKVAEISELKGNEKLPVPKNMPLLGNTSSIDIYDYISKDKLVESNGLLMIKNNSTNWKIQQPLQRILEVDKDFAYFLGLYTSEGTVYGNNGVIITNSSSEVISRLRVFIKKLNINPDTKINKNSFRFYCKVLVRFLSENCGIPNPKIRGKGKTCYTKEVPSFIFGCSQDVIAEYLKGCFDGDGTVSSELAYNSTSEKLVSGMAILLQLLNIEFYIHKKSSRNSKYRDSFVISIPRKEFGKFRDIVGLYHPEKRRKLNKLIAQYASVSLGTNFKNSFKLSKLFANKLRECMDDHLPKQKIVSAFCPLCSNFINKNSKYKDVQRYYCFNCKKIFYENDIVKKEVEKYIYYDSSGRFLKNSVPWNKSINTADIYSATRLKNILIRRGAQQLMQVFSESIIWDEILKIEKVDYDSWVYDFTVPGVENFASGFGGIITHNSASFAGQMVTYVNVKGAKKVIEAVQKCWASLFTARAIYYRVKNNFDHSKVLIAVIIQKMVESEKAGVMFSVNPTTNKESEIMIEGAFGLGDAVVAGEVTPDNYIIDKNGFKILYKKIGRQEWMYSKNDYTGETYKKDLSEEKGSRQKLTDEEIVKLAKYGSNIEKHYKKPMDVEWAIEGMKIFIVQARPITTLNNKKEEHKEVCETPILTGMGASPGVGTGVVKIVNNLDELEKVKEGDVLVAKMTSPDYVSVMRKAKAIVTDEGGSTSHAAIVSRELGIPCTVGTGNATTILHDGQLITVDGSEGKVYEGKIEIVCEDTGEKEMIEKYHDVKTKTKVYMNLGEPEKIDAYKDIPFEGIGLMRIEFIVISYIKRHPLRMIETGDSAEFVDKLAEGIEKVASAIGSRPVIVRFSDFKTNEYKHLEGGEEFEPDEENPMIGWRGVSRYVSFEFKEAFKLECKAIKKLRDSGYKNVHVMLPFVRNVDEVKKVLEIMREEGLVRDNEFKIYLMAEVPSISIIPEEFSKLDIDGASIGSNDLTQLILGVDRDSSKLGRMGYFDERNEAVKKAMASIIKGFHKNGKTVGICGQSVSVYPEITEFLVNLGIDSVSVNPDVIEKTHAIIAKLEKG